MYSAPLREIHPSGGRKSHAEAQRAQRNKISGSRGSGRPSAYSAPLREIHPSGGRKSHAEAQRAQRNKISGSRGSGRPSAYSAPLREIHTSGGRKYHAEAQSAQRNKYNPARAEARTPLCTQRLCVRFTHPAAENITWRRRARREINKSSSRGSENPSVPLCDIGLLFACNC